MNPDCLLSLLKPEAFDSIEPLRPVHIAVIDSGIDGSHPSFAGRVGSAVRLGVGAETAIVGVEVTSDNDRYGHGTSVAGIISRHAPHAVLHDIGVLDERNTATGRVVVDALEYALDLDVELINISIAVTKKFRDEFARLAAVAVARQKIIVASQRNLPFQGDLGMPAEVAGVIGVGVRHESKAQLYYRLGSSIQFASVDGLITSKKGGGEHRSYGTSLATPFVTSLCANVLGRSPAQLPQFVVETALYARALQHNALWTLRKKPPACES